MKKNKIPMRMCIVTRESYPKKELIRIVKTKDNHISIDETGKANGRGVYLKLEKTIINKAIDKKILEKVLQTQIPKTIIDELINMIK